jgi:hypothetical protein
MHRHSMPIGLNCHSRRYPKYQTLCLFHGLLVQLLNPETGAAIRIWIVTMQETVLPTIDVHAPLFGEVRLFTSAASRRKHRCPSFAMRRFGKNDPR